MAAYEFSGPRLFVAHPLAAGAAIALDRSQANYLLNVLRLREGDTLLVFNGADGEWRARIAKVERRGAVLEAVMLTRPQPSRPHLVYLFAPLKHARLDYMVQKAVEMGAGVLQPVLTRRTEARRVNLERMRANVVEAAEQCGILTLAEVREPSDLAAALDALGPDRLLVFCDEDAPLASPLVALEPWRGRGAAPALLIGPEGGFAEDERAGLLARARLARLSLGPRILRADTAAVAALAVVQAVLGDWR